MSVDYRMSQRAIDQLKAWEGFMPMADLCPAGVPTIGYGHTKGVTMQHVTDKRQITAEAAEVLLRQDVSWAEDAVRRMVSVPISQAQFDALVSFAFNLGAWSLQASTLLKLLNQGDYAGAAQQFQYWCHAQDPKTHKMVALPGLVKRRAIEAQWFSEQNAH